MLSRDRLGHSSEIEGLAGYRVPALVVSVKLAAVFVLQDRFIHKKSVSAVGQNSESVTCSKHR